MPISLKLLAGGVSALALVYASVALAASAAPPLPPGQMLMHKNISLDQAITVVQGAMEACKDSSISITVVDREGEVRYAVRANGANPHNFELSRRKAYTARTFRMPSADWIKRTAPDQDLYGQRQLKEVIPLGGGMPIMAGTDAIGAVGISGARGGQPAEEACARAGIAKIQGQLS
jgi:uncharacterized protein GlcG (DUF336 family)